MANIDGMRSTRDSWLDYLQDYIRDNPRLAAAIAFQVGIIAGAATKNAGQMMRRSGAASTLMDALPSSLAGLMPMGGSGRGRKRAAAGTSTRGRRKTTARKRKRKAA
jgi:hypothetical protein